MGSVFQVVEISPWGKRVAVLNCFTPQKAQQQQACAPSLRRHRGCARLHARASPWAQESLLRNGWSWGENAEQGALESISNSCNSQKTKQERI